MNTAAAFVQALVQRGQLADLQTITLRIIRDLPTSPALPVVDGLRPVVFRIVRSAPNAVFSGIVAKLHLDQLRGEKQPLCPSLIGILAADAAIFNFPSKADFIALRVIDNKSIESEYNDVGRHWPGAERERLFFDMLERSALEYKTVAAWLTHLLQYPQAVVPLQGKHWGLCGAHYGLEGATAVSIPIDL
ncbi:hypothetical protein C8A05DRAFT_40086, partial [Staphylotrichum tortipilum]